jgi:hypothetical protein
VHRNDEVIVDHPIRLDFGKYAPDLVTLDAEEPSFLALIPRHKTA